MALFFLLQTPTGMPANFKHVGPFLLIDAIPSYFCFCDRGKQSQLLLRPTKVQLGLQVGVEFDKRAFYIKSKLRIHLQNSTKIFKNFAFVLKQIRKCAKSRKFKLRTTFGFQRS